MNISRNSVPRNRDPFVSAAAGQDKGSSIRGRNIASAGDGRPGIPELFQKTTSSSTSSATVQGPGRSASSPVAAAPVSVFSALSPLPEKMLSVVAVPDRQEDVVAPPRGAVPTLLPYEGPEPNTFEEYTTALKAIFEFYETRPERIGMREVTCGGAVYPCFLGRDSELIYFKFTYPGPNQASHTYTPDKNIPLLVEAPNVESRTRCFQLKHLGKVDRICIRALMKELFNILNKPLPVLKVLKNEERCQGELLKECPWFMSLEPVPPEELLIALASGIDSDHRDMSLSNTSDVAAAAPSQGVGEVVASLDSIYYLRSKSKRAQARQELYQKFSWILVPEAKPVDLSEVLVSYKGEKITLCLDSEKKLKIQRFDARSKREIWTLMMTQDGNISGANEESDLVVGIMTLLWFEQDSLVEYITDRNSYMVKILQQIFNLAEIATSVTRIPSTKIESAVSSTMASGPVSTASAGDGNSSKIITLSKIKSTLVAADSELEWTIKIDGDSSVTFSSIKTNARGWGRACGDSPSRMCEFRFNASTRQIEVTIEREESSRISSSFQKTNKYVLSLDADGAVTLVFESSTTNTRVDIGVFNRGGFTYGAVESIKHKPTEKEILEDVSFLCRTWHGLSGVFKDPLAVASGASNTEAYRSPSGPVCWDIETHFLSGKRVPDNVLMAIMKYRQQDLRGRRSEFFHEFSSTLPLPPSIPQPPSISLLPFPIRTVVPKGRRG